MKLVLSRKGFDSGKKSGGRASPIFPDGAMKSLPIPDKKSNIKYSELNYKGLSLGQLVVDLTGEDKRLNHFAHLDPDLDSDTIGRPPGWRPSLGQTGRAQSHLRNQKVGIGDLFLFFGLFQSVEQRDRAWRFTKNSKELHVLWGWLQVGEIHKVATLSSNDLPWARYHPHFHGNRGSANTLYVAADKLRLGGKRFDVPGAGIFPRFNEQLLLTDLTEENTRSLLTQWRLPAAFYPDSGKPPLSYHGKSWRWRRSEDAAYCGLRSVSRGQEFVLDLNHYPEVLDWLESLLVS